MARDKENWREFERLVARIEKAAAPLNAVVKSPDRVRSKVTGRLREVDASIRTTVGTADILITIECRKRAPRQDVTWIEQLASKKDAIGASRTLAVSSSGFSADAERAARHYGIDLRRLADISVDEVVSWLSIDFVTFPIRDCALVSAHVRFHVAGPPQMPSVDRCDWLIPKETPFDAEIFRNTETGERWSLNGLWRQAQETIRPFDNLPPDGKFHTTTGAFVYNGNVTVETPNGPRPLGDVVLSVAVSKKWDLVTLANARKVQYTSSDGLALQRVEFQGQHPQTKELRLGLQAPRDAVDASQMKVEWPN